MRKHWSPRRKRKTWTGSWIASLGMEAVKQDENQIEQDCSGGDMGKALGAGTHCGERWWGTREVHGLGKWCRGLC